MKIKRDGKRFELECASEEEAIKLYVKILPMAWNASTFSPDDSLLPGTLKHFDDLVRDAQYVSPYR
jgi:hypothetical protein